MNMTRAKLWISVGMTTLIGGCVASSDDPDPRRIAAARDESSRVGTTAARATIPFRTNRGIVQVPVDVRNERAFIGDMGFGRIDDMRPRAAGLQDLDARWPEGKVPYCFDDDDLDLAMKNRFRDATDYISARVPQVRFIESECGVGVLRVHSTGEPGGTSRASVGYSGLGDDIELGLAADAAVIRHELGHVLGLRHEQARFDRDDFVEVCIDNVDPGHAANYDIEPSDEIDLLTPYDYHSIMHYGRDAFLSPFPIPTLCDGHAMRAIQDTFPETSAVNAELGRMGDFTRHDINALTLMYGRALGTENIGARFGSSIAVADFDDDGYDDVVVASPQNAAGYSGMPFLFFYKGTERGVAPSRILALKDHPSEDGDQLGASMVVGDFDSDGFRDLAVGAPGRRNPLTGVRSGAVYVLYGGQFTRANYDAACAAGACTGDANGPFARSQTIFPEQIFTGISSADAFGTSLAVADFTDDGRQDLVVGAPGMSGHGRVFVFRQSSAASGLITTSAIWVTPSTALSNGDRFGTALVTADFSGDGRSDLAVGAPSDAAGAGAVYRFSGNGASLAQVQRIQPVLPKGSLFGSSLAAGWFYDMDLHVELAVGAPAQKNPSGVAAGAVHFYKEGVFGMLAADPAGPVVSGASSEERFGAALMAANVETSGLSLSELFVGAPARAGGGRVVVLKNTSGTISNHQSISSSVPGFGSSFARGAVRHAPPFVGYPVTTLRIFIGAPESVGAGPSPYAGSVHAYKLDGGLASNVFSFSEGWSSYWAAP